MSLLTRFKPLKTMARFDPFAEFDDTFRGFGLRPWTRPMEEAPEIRMDVEDFDKSYRIVAEIPGVKKEDIAISVEHGIVSISAEFKREVLPKEGDKILYGERSFGKAFRSFSLPVEVDADAAQAKFENGLLTLDLPKKPNGLTRRIVVN